MTKNDDRWHPMCSHPLSQGACVDRLLGEEECRSPFGTYELLIPKDDTLSCDQPGIRNKNCKDLDVSWYGESIKSGIVILGRVAFEGIWHLRAHWPIFPEPLLRKIRCHVAASFLVVWELFLGFELFFTRNRKYGHAHDHVIGKAKVYKRLCFSTYQSILHCWVIFI